MHIFLSRLLLNYDALSENLFCFKQLRVHFQNDLG